MIEEEINEEKIKNIKRIKKTYEKIFYREIWIDNKIPFAETWLNKNDEEWLNKNKNCNKMNDTFYNNK